MDSLESETRHKCIVALELILKKCDDFNVLDGLLIPPIPDEIIIYILEKLSKVISIFLIKFLYFTSYLSISIIRAT